MFRQTNLISALLCILLWTAGCKGGSETVTELCGRIDALTAKVKDCKTADDLDATDREMSSLLNEYSTSDADITDIEDRTKFSESISAYLHAVSAKIVDLGIEDNSEETNRAVDELCQRASRLIDRSRTLGKAIEALNKL